MAPTPARVLDSQQADVPPLGIHQGIVAPAAQIGSLQNYPATAQDIRWDFSFYLAPGCGIRIASSVGNLNGVIFGRVF